jgi:hypothetical protein
VEKAIQHEIMFSVEVQANNDDRETFIVSYSNKSHLDKRYVDGKELVGQPSDNRTHINRKERVSKHVVEVTGMTEDVHLVKDADQNQTLCATSSQTIFAKPHLRMMINNVDIFCFFSSPDLPHSDFSRTFSWYQYNDKAALNYTIAKPVKEQIKYMKDALFMDRYINRCFDEVRCLTKAAVMRLPIFEHDKLYSKDPHGTLIPMLQRKRILNTLQQKVDEQRNSILHNRLTRNQSDFTTTSWILGCLHDHKLLEFIKKVIIPHWQSTEATDQIIYFTPEDDETAIHRFGNCDEAEFIKYHFDAKDYGSKMYQEDESYCSVM